MRFLELKIPPVIVGLVVAAAMWLAARFAPALGGEFPGRSVLAAALALAGAAVAAAGVISFRRARTTVNPLRPEAASSLVVVGVYRRTRNPMYLGMLLVLLGWAAALGNAAAAGVALGFIPLMNSLQIAPEERILTERFGGEFTTYRSRVRRWI